MRLRRQLDLLQEERDTIKDMLSLKTKKFHSVHDQIRLLQEIRKILDDLIDVSKELRDDRLQMILLAEKRENIRSERQLLL